MLRDSLNSDRSFRSRTVVARVQATASQAAVRMIAGLGSSNQVPATVAA